MVLFAMYDLTEGSIPGKLTRLALPILGTSALQLLYHLTDMFWLGRLSTESLAGAGIGGFVVWLCASVSAIPKSGTEIMVSAAKGRRQFDEIDHIAGLSLLWSVIIGLAFSLLTVPGAPHITALFRLSDLTAAAEGTRYIRIIGYGAVFLILFPAMSSFSIALGDSRTPLRVSVITIGLNMILDPLLISAFGLKAGGAALATVVSNSVGCMLLAFSLRAHYLKPAAHRISGIGRKIFAGSRRFLRLGLPQGIESCSYALLSAYVATFFGHYGSTILAANSLGAQVESLTWIIAAGLSTAAVAFSGQNFGAGKIDRIRGSFNALLGITALYSGIIMCILLFGGRSLASIFTADAALIDSTARYFAILAISQPFMALELAMAGLYRGIQRPTIPAVISFFFTLARAPLSLFVFRAGLSHEYIWWIISASSVVKGVLITAMFLPFLGAAQKAAIREG